MSGAHLGGSWWYGKPRPDSDLDLCILVTEEEADIIGALADMPQARRDEWGSFPVRYGRLNIIVCTELDTYDAWKRGRDALKKQAPVTREQAKSMFKDLGVSKG